MIHKPVGGRLMNTKPIQNVGAGLEGWITVLQLMMQREGRGLLRPQEMLQHIHNSVA